jgi:hypothetical protein
MDYLRRIARRSGQPVPRNPVFKDYSSADKDKLARVAYDTAERKLRNKYRDEFLSILDKERKALGLRPSRKRY